MLFAPSLFNLMYWSDLIYVSPVKTNKQRICWWEHSWFHVTFLALILVGNVLSFICCLLACCEAGSHVTASCFMFSKHPKKEKRKKCHYLSCQAAFCWQQHEQQKQHVCGELQTSLIGFFSPSLKCHVFLFKLVKLMQFYNNAAINLNKHHISWSNSSKTMNVAHFSVKGQRQKNEQNQKNCLNYTEIRNTWWTNLRRFKVWRLKCLSTC